MPAVVLLGGVTGVVLKFILDRGACAGLGTLLPGDNEPGEPGYNKCVDSGPSFPAAFGLGAGIAIPVWVAFPLYGGEWTPW